MGELKGLVSTRMPGQDVQDMKLVYRAKFLSDERKTLAEAGIKPGPVQLHLVSRWERGEKAPTITQQLTLLEFQEKKGSPIIQ